MRSYAGTVGGGAAAARDYLGGYPVEFVKDGPGRAVMSSDFSGDCLTAEAMTLVFTLRGRAVVIEDVWTHACLVPRSLADDLTGATLRILPLGGT
jgi:hypothetical protein